MDDSDLLLRYADDGDQDAFRELVRRHLPVVLGAAMRQVGGDLHLAQDVVQRVFSALARKARTLCSQPGLAGWLYTAARLEAARMVRTEARRRRREEKAGSEDRMTADDAGNEVDWARLSPVLDLAMAELAVADRDAVLLRFFYGKSFPEIGRDLRLSEEAARKRVDRAVDRLRTIVGQRGLTSSGAALTLALGARAAMVPPPGAVEAMAAQIAKEMAAASVAKASAFMSMNKLGTAAAAALIAVAAGVAIRDTAALMASGRIERALAEESAEAGRQRQTLEQELAGLNSKLAPPQGNQTAGEIPADPARPYLKDPVYRNLARLSSQSRTHLEFQRLYRKLALTSDQIQRFEDIKAQQDQANLDAMAVRDTGGNPQAIYEQSGTAWSSAMGALLGADGFAQLQTYLRSMPVRAFVDSLAGPTNSLGEPITEQQADQLGDIALANDPVFASGRGTDPGNVNWEAVMAPAAQVLSPAQFNALQLTVQSWVFQHQVQQGLVSR